MFKKTVYDLIRINELFEEADSVTIHRLNKFISIQMVNEEGEINSEVLTKREFALIQRNFYIHTLNQIIELGIDNKLEVTLDNTSVHFPVTVEIFDALDNSSIDVAYCNFMEMDFIHNALHNQKSKEITSN